MKTTILGILLASATVIQAHDLTDWKSWLVPALVAALGYVAADHKTE